MIGVLVHGVVKQTNANVENQTNCVIPSFILLI